MNGYEYTRQLKAKIAESPTHTLDTLDKALSGHDSKVRINIIEQ